MGQNLWAVSIALFCIGQLLGSLNFIATTLDLRTKGMTLARMPLSTWAWFITACIGLLAFADLLPACILLILDRTAGTSFFNPAGMVVSDTLLPHSGGSPLLWQHLFWFFGHPEVYIAIVPGFGIISHILPAFTRKPLLGGMRVMIGCMIAIGFLSYMVWGHHMFVSGMNPFSALLFSVPTSDHHHSRDRGNADVARLDLRREFAVYQRVALLPRLHLGVYQRRNQRLLPGAAGD